MIFNSSFANQYISIQLNILINPHSLWNFMATFATSVIIHSFTHLLLYYCQIWVGSQPWCVMTTLSSHISPELITECCRYARCPTHQTYQENPHWGTSWLMFNPLRPDIIYMCKWIGSSLVQVMYIPYSARAGRYGMSFVTFLLKIGLLQYICQCQLQLHVL